MDFYSLQWSVAEGPQESPLRQAVFSIGRTEGGFPVLDQDLLVNVGTERKG